MTKREAAIVTAYTGILIGTFSDFQEFAEVILDRPVFTHEFATGGVWDELKELVKPLFVGIEVK